MKILKQMSRIIMRADFNVQKHKERRTTANITPLVAWKRYWCFRLLSFQLWTSWRLPSTSLLKMPDAPRPGQFDTNLLQFSKVTAYQLTNSLFIHACPVSFSNKEPLTRTFHIHYTVQYLYQDLTLFNFFINDLYNTAHTQLCEGCNAW